MATATAARRPRTDRPDAAIPGKSHTVWLAIGVIVTKWLPPFRRRSNMPQGVEWRYVTTQAKHRGDSRFTVVDCPDIFYSNATDFVRPNSKIRMGFQFSCFCKTAQWFRRGLSLFPTARFIGKMEDDSILHDSRAVAELAEAYHLARREPGSVRRPALWYGHFAWVH